MLITEQFIKILDEKLEEKFEQKITPLSQTIVDLKSKVEDVVEHITFINAKYDELYLKLEASEKENKSIMEENKILKMSIQQLERSVTTLDQAHDLEQYGRRECIEISGIPLLLDQVKVKI
jgi:regulator of replication initiation timing